MAQVYESVLSFLHACYRYSPFRRAFYLGPWLPGRAVLVPALFFSLLMAASINLGALARLLVAIADGCASLLVTGDLPTLPLTIALELFAFVSPRLVSQLLMGLFIGLAAITVLQLYLSTILHWPEEGGQLQATWTCTPYRAAVHLRRIDLTGNRRPAIQGLYAELDTLISELAKNRVHEFTLSSPLLGGGLARRKIKKRLEARQVPTGLQLEVAELSPDWLDKMMGWLAAKTYQLSKTGKTPSTGKLLVQIRQRAA